jgi:predicted nucleotidyltransferase
VSGRTLRRAGERQTIRWTRFGSVARGDGQEGSDVDVLVRIRGGWKEQPELVPEGSSTKVLEQLEAEGVISKSRRERLAAIYRVRNEMQHAYPDVAIHATYEAARSLLDELGGFFNDYARWLRELGYG